MKFVGWTVRTADLIRALLLPSRKSAGISLLVWLRAGDQVMTLSLWRGLAQWLVLR